METDTVLLKDGIRFSEKDKENGLLIKPQNGALALAADLQTEAKKRARAGIKSTFVLHFVAPPTFAGIKSTLRCAISERGGIRFSEKYKELGLCETYKFLYFRDRTIRFFNKRRIMLLQLLEATT